jgi:D-serine deaminase-like pyridoxal phosphate-dependent protein
MSPEPLPTPFVAVDRQLMLANITAMADHAASVGALLRPHAKTHKTPAIARRQVQAGAVGLTVATVAEAEVFSRFGFDDLFIAYPIWVDHESAHRLEHVLERARVRVGVDSEAGARALAVLAGHERLSVAVEVDCGQRRSGVSPHDAGRVAALAGLHVDGVFTFPGHSYAPGAAGPVATAEAEALAAAGESLRAAGVAGELRSGGSTPSAAAVKAGALTEIRPGVYVFGDAQQWELGSCRREQIALTVHATVVSHAGGRLILNSGSKVLGADRAPWASGHGRLLDHPDARVVLLAEHHAVVEMPGRLPALGSRVRVVPNHVCNCVNSVEALFVMDDGEPSDTWAVAARGANT